MFENELRATAQAMVAPGKGILAADESFGTANKRFQKLGIPTTEEMRRAYREMLFTTPGIGDFFSGVILFDETIRQSTADGVPFVQLLSDQGIIPGIKLDAGAKPLAKSPNELITEGLDGLRDRVKEYYEMGARFAKWRAVITIGDGIPTRRCIEANAHALARYAGICQEGGLVPIVEPEVLMDGDHSLERSYAVHEEVLKTVFYELHRSGIVLDQMVLKPSMVISGQSRQNQASVDEVAHATVKCLLDCVPASVPGCAFLSGGQTDQQATEHLNMMNVLYGGKLPWKLTFSYGRALQQAAMQAWMGKPENVPTAQKALSLRAKCNSAASLGRYSPEMEKVAASV
ncbi:class I fructose-bisphosphate aldolase [Leptolyngbya ohadii]|uniref:class I fructose-bisphosphate aldolase n=1 Tax=Leptolyngbya ohadii TaxID=1962290 RepID=UPI000B59A7DD|nr:class I fructose-bisphosphate aldolase [Leptolyngbya ohadii]